MIRTQAYGSRIGFTQLFAFLRWLDAMVHGIAQDVHDRIFQFIENAFVELGFFATHLKVDRLAPLVRKIASGIQRRLPGHVLRDDPTDSIANYAKPAPLSPQFVAALDDFVGK